MGSAEKALAVIEPRGNQMITPAGSIEDAVEQFKLYQELKEKLGTDDDFQPIAGKKHPKKSFVRKVQKFFNLSCEILQDEPLKDEGKIIAWIATVRATHLPTGAYQDADGSCSFDEKAEKQCTIHNVRAHAVTRAKNRAILDLVGFGEVSAEELPHDYNGESGSASGKEMTYEQAANTVVDFGKKYKGKKLSEATEDYIQWMMTQKIPDKLKMACVIYLNGPDQKEWEQVDDTDLPFGDDSDLPFNNNPTPDPPDNGKRYCSGCGIEVTKARATLSEKKHGQPYCIKCKE